MKNTAIAFCILLLIVLYAGFKVHVYYEVKSLFPYSWGDLKYLEKVPTTLELNSETLLDTRKIEFYDLMLECPDKELFKNTIGENEADFFFTDSTSIVITYDSHIDALDYMNLEWADDIQLDLELLEEYFMENNIKTNYQLLSHVYALQPGGISWFASNSSIKIRYALLKLKEVTLAVGVENDFKKFNTKFFRGFIFGDLKKNERIIITGFTESDQQYTMVFKGFDLETIVKVLNSIHYSR